VTVLARQKSRRSEKRALAQSLLSLHVTAPDGLPGRLGARDVGAGIDNDAEQLRAERHDGQAGVRGKGKGHHHGLSGETEAAIGMMTKVLDAVAKAATG
jgi:hypothetical protein